MSVPKLRFKEFKNDWHENSLGNISENVMYGMNAAAIPYDGVNKYIRITDIDEDTREFIPNPLSSPNGEIEDKYKLQNGDIVFARTGASVGKSYLYKEKDGNLLFAGFLIKFSITDADPYFVYLQTLTESYKSWITVMSMRSGQPGVNAEEFKEFKFLTPQLNEQTKIASFLTAVDEKITQLTQKCDLLAQYKKGVMQQIFSQELRFKDDDGRDFPDWKEKTIEDEIDFLSGYPFDGADISEDNSGIRLMRGVNITEGSIRSNAEIDRYYVGDIEPLSKYFIKENDLVIGMDGSKVGKNSAMVKSIDSNTLLVQRVARLRANPKSSIFFIYQNINSLKFHAYVDKVKTSSGIPHISAKQIKEFKIFFPVFEEQTKIANFLSAIDDKITHTQAQLAAVKQYKQGLLQQMFV